MLGRAGVLVLLFAIAFAISYDELVQMRYASEVPPSEFFVANEDTVSTQYGTVVGAVYKTARAFYAIPYAQPPLDDLRWALPQPNLPWGNLMAKKYGPGCPQECDLPPFTCTYAGTSEDCLTLDIYTPRAGTVSGLSPVLVFIHGGNFIQGGTGTILYNADYLSNNTQIVVVNIQYRLGALGFFYNGNVTGNFGIYDQTLALEWISENIQSFGGDPTKVTIWGQSAGGTSVACHMISPASFPYFRAGAMDSNPITLYLNSLKLAEEISDRFASILGCSSDDMDCLRAQDTTDILNAQQEAIEIYPLHPLNAFMPWQPMVDGTLIPQQPLDAFAAGNFNQVPFLSGTVNDEGVMFIYEVFVDPIPYDEYIALIGLIFGEVAPQVIAEYPVPPSQMNDTRPTLSTLGTDYIFTCPLRQALRQIANYSVPVHYYHFNHYFTNFDPWGPAYSMCIDEVCHGSELPYVFNSAEIGNFYTGYVWSSDEAVLANQASTFWGNYATSLNPNTPFPVTLNWPLYNQTYDQDMEFETPSVIETGYLQSYCDFWDSVGYTWGN